MNQAVPAHKAGLALRNTIGIPDDRDSADLVRQDDAGRIDSTRIGCKYVG